MLTGQVVAFLLILQTALVIEADVAETASELDSASRLSMMEISSENVMLDCCLRLHTWVRGSSEPTGEEILSRAGAWEAQVTEYLCAMGMNCTVALNGVAVEPLENQTVDPRQTGFLGRRGDERWHISATLIVRLVMGPFLAEAIYPISIIA